ncbi:MAG: hypothetical protein Q8K32_07255 [Archangium sp.]|nr:hypothetical protein [Archangium sp.]
MTRHATAHNGVDGKDEGLEFRFHGRDTVQVLESWVLSSPCTSETLRSALRGLRTAEDRRQPEDLGKVAVPESQNERRWAAEKLAAIVAVSTALGLKLERAQLRRQIPLRKDGSTWVIPVQPFKTRAPYIYRASFGEGREAESEWAQILAWRAAEYGDLVLRGAHFGSAPEPDHHPTTTDPQDLAKYTRNTAMFDLNWICDRLQPVIALLSQELLRTGAVSGPFARGALRKVLGAEGLQSISARDWRSRSAFALAPPMPAAQAHALAERTGTPSTELEAPETFNVPGNNLRN